MPAQITVVGPGRLHIGPDATGAPAFSAQVRSAKLVPSVTIGDPIDLLDGSTAPGDRSESFALVGTFQQDFGKVNSVVEWLFEHRGEVHPFEYVPNNVDGRMISGDLTVEAVDLGGDVKTKPTSDFEYAVVGEPIISTDPDL